MARFKNVGGADVDLFAPGGAYGGYTVEADSIVEVPGEVTNADDRDADHYLVGSGDEARAWPKATWRVTAPGDQSGGGDKNDDEEG